MGYEMRRADRKISESEAKQLLLSGSYGVLSMTGSGGKPYGVPVFYLYRNGRLYFHGAKEGRKAAHLQENRNASFCVVGQMQVLPAHFSARYESVIAEGEVYIAEGEEKEAALHGFIEKYSPEFLEKGAAYIQAAKEKTCVFGMTVTVLSGKARR